MKKNYIRNLNIIILLFSIAALMMIFTKNLGIYIQTISVNDGKIIYPAFKDYFYGYNFAFKISTKVLQLTRFNIIILIGYFLPVLLSIISIVLFYIKRDSNIKYFILGSLLIILSLIVIFELRKIYKIYTHELAVDMAVIFDSKITLETGALLNCFFTFFAGLVSLFTGIIVPIFEKEKIELRRKTK